MKQRNAELLLAGVIVARATSLLFSKLSMRALDPFNLLGLRFSIAFGLLMLLFGRRFRGVKLRTVFHGFLLGASFFAVMTAELFGLRLRGGSLFLDRPCLPPELHDAAVCWRDGDGVLHTICPGRNTVDGRPYDGGAIGRL